MRLKILLSLGTGLVKELGLEFADKDGNAIYTEGSVREVEDKAADILIKRGLAETTTEPVTVLVKGVAQQPAVRAVPTPATPANFGENPHESPPGSVEKATEDLEAYRKKGGK